MARSAVLAIVLVAAIAVSATALAANTPRDAPAALLVYPYVTVDSRNGTETVLHLANSSDAAVRVHCFLEDAGAYCSGGANSGAICHVAADCASGSCTAHWSFADFSVRLTARQPISWRASAGLSDLPVPGNSGAISPAPRDPFLGLLRCVAVDETDQPLRANPLIGDAVVESIAEGEVDVARYAAFGSQVLGTNNGDRVLTLGGTTSEAEYASCSQALVVGHAFDGAIDPIDGGTVETTLVLVPCGVDYAAGEPLQPIVIYTVIDELGTGMSGQLQMADGHLAAPLGVIDPVLLTVGARGTSNGWSVIETADTTGLLGLVIERHRHPGDPERVFSAARLASGLLAASPADRVVLPPPPCTGDCDGSLAVSLAELVRCIRIVNDVSPLADCRRCDRDGDGADLADIVRAVRNAALGGCR